MMVNIGENLRFLSQICMADDFLTLTLKLLIVNT